MLELVELCAGIVSLSRDSLNGLRVTIVLPAELE